MGRLALPLFTTLCLLIIAATYWYFRPGSEFSPREVLASSRVEDRREGYRMMDKIYPSVRVAQADPVTTFARAADPIDLDFTYTWRDQSRTLDTFVAERKVQGIYVLKDAEVVYEDYYGDADANDQFTSWSVAKSVVSSLIGIALMEGEIKSLDDKAADYALDYRGTDYGDTSLRHLLMMSSGIAFNEDYEAPGSDIRKLFLNTFLLHRDVDDTVRTFRRERPAGEAFNYISTDTQVLAAVLRGAYGQSLIKTFNEKLAQPLGLSGGSWLTDRLGPGGKELGYCCLQLTLEDYAKLGQLYVQRGVVGGKRLLPHGWTRFVALPTTPSHQPAGDGILGYGHHFWVIGGEKGAMTMQGYNGQRVHIDPEERVVVVITAADRTPRVPDEPEYIALVDAIKDRL